MWSCAKFMEEKLVRFLFLFAALVNKKTEVVTAQWFDSVDWAIPKVSPLEFLA